MIENFGVILATYHGDYSFVKGCCASIRYFLGNIPICLIVDGRFSLKPLEETYGVNVINRSNVTHEALGKRSFGWGLTKMVAFWESPWENFLYLDADTIVWGDLFKFANFKDFDVIIDKPCYEYSESDVNKWFFNVEKIEEYFPGFTWRNRPYFCTGTFFAKRDIFSLSEYLNLLELQIADPQLFYPGEQGLLNLMIFRAADQGRIRLGHEDMQLIVPDFPPKQLRKRFSIEKTGPAIQESTVIHWCGKKPFISRSEVFPEPMNFFRRKFLQDAENCTGLRAELSLQIEDFNMYKTKLLRRIGISKPTN
jgi:hypothetical protein